MLTTFTYKRQLGKFKVEISRVNGLATEQYSGTQVHDVVLEARDYLHLLIDPLGHYRPGEISFVVREFAKEHGFIREYDLEEHEEDLNRLQAQSSITDVDLLNPGVNGRLACFVLLERGFFLGRNRHFRTEFKNHLSRDDHEALEKERQGSLLHHPWGLYAVILLCSLAGQLQGWDQVGSSGANLTWPWRFHLNTNQVPRDAWIVGAVNAAPYLISPIGCFLSDPMNNWLGRLKTIFVAALLCFVSVFGCAFVEPPHWAHLAILRCLLGIGMGLKASTVPLITAESAPYRVRGSMVMQWQLNVAAGIFLGSIANMVTHRFKDPWRYQFGCAFIPAVPVMIAVWFIPESPVWLLRQGRVLDAYKSLRRLRPRPVIACRDLFVMYYANEIEQRCMRMPPRAENGYRGQFTYLRTYVSRMLELMTISRNRRATQSSVLVMMVQQFCGINLIAFYCNTLFLGNDYSGPTKSPYYVDETSFVTSALSVSIAFGFTNFIFSFPAVKAIERFGRLSLLLTTLPFMAVLLMGLSLAFRSDGTISNVFKGIFIVLFTICYSCGCGPVPFTYAAEVFPASHRDCGMAFSVSINLFFAGILAICYPAQQARWGSEWAVGFYAVLNIVGFVLVSLFVVETRQLPLEVLTERFSHSTWSLVVWRLSKFWGLDWIPFKLLRNMRTRALPQEYEMQGTVIEVANKANSSSTAEANSTPTLNPVLEVHEAPGPKFV